MTEHGHISAVRLKYRVLLPANAKWVCFSEIIAMMDQPTMFRKKWKVIKTTLKYTEYAGVYKVLGVGSDFSGVISLELCL